MLRFAKPKVAEVLQQAKSDMFADVTPDDFRTLVEGIVEDTIVRIARGVQNYGALSGTTKQALGQVTAVACIFSTSTNLVSKHTEDICNLLRTVSVLVFVVVVCVVVFAVVVVVVGLFLCCVFVVLCCCYFLLLLLVVVVFVVVIFVGVDLHCFHCVPSVP